MYLYLIMSADFGCW